MKWYLVRLQIIQWTKISTKFWTDGRRWIYNKRYHPPNGRHPSDSAVCMIKISNRGTSACQNTDTLPGINSLSGEFLISVGTEGTVQWNLDSEFRNPPSNWTYRTHDVITVEHWNHWITSGSRTFLLLLGIWSRSLWISDRRCWWVGAQCVASQAASHACFLTRLLIFFCLSSKFEVISGVFSFCWASGNLPWAVLRYRSMRLRNLEF